ncbi:MAG: hypothetical protein AB7T31_10480 [Gemmatimonadales bacterium]
MDTDATATAQPALEGAVQLAIRSGARLTVVHVASVPPHASCYARLEEVVGGDADIRLPKPQGDRELEKIPGRESSAAAAPSCILEVGLDDTLLV